MIRFVRVTYVRPQDEAIECVTMYSPPPGKLNNSGDIDVPGVIIKRHENTVELYFIRAMRCRFESFCQYRVASDTIFMTGQTSCTKLRKLFLYVTVCMCMYMFIVYRFQL